MLHKLQDMFCTLKALRIFGFSKLKIFCPMCFSSIGSKFLTSNIITFSKNVTILFILYCFPKCKAASFIFGYGTLYQVLKPPHDRMRSQAKVKFHRGSHQRMVSPTRIAMSFSLPHCQVASRQNQRCSTIYLASNTL